MKNKILISKDILMKDYLPVYNSEFPIKTPNIDELAKKGTVFHRHYTVAPSTAMAFTGMFLGIYPYQTKRKKYEEVTEIDQVNFFDELQEMGYDCHIVWDESYVNLAYKFSKCYGKNTKFHNVKFLTKKLKKHVMGRFDDLEYEDEFTKIALIEFEKLLQSTVKKENIFIWIHFPHVIAGRNSYGSDIDVLDEMVGIIRKYFEDDSVYLTADHGHMNGADKKYGYGFDLHENAICIPLITPRICDREYIEFPTVNMQLREIIIESSLTKLDYVISETAYYMQPHRKIAIIKDNVKLIYEKENKKYYLYDLTFDKEENINLFYPEIYDIDRKRKFSISQRIYYRNWEKMNYERKYLKNEILKIWKNGPWLREIIELIIYKIKIYATKLLNR